MDLPIRKLSHRPGHAEDLEPFLTREWLLTNGLGGYASGTIAGIPTRRYHGVLVAALPAPLGRFVMLSCLSEEIVLPDGHTLELCGEHCKTHEVSFPGASFLAEFCLEGGLPSWKYAFREAVLEKRVLMPHRQNTVHIAFRLLEGPLMVRLSVGPFFHFRPHEEDVNSASSRPYVLNIQGERYEVSTGSDLPSLKMLVSPPGSFVSGPREREAFYRLEARRGYQSEGRLWSPGRFTCELRRGEEVTFVASTESWPAVTALAPAEALAAERQRRKHLLGLAPIEAQTGPTAELVLAADQFIITPTTREDDTARAHAAGDELRTVIAGYHWFTDWGRDTMISLEGLTLATGRHQEARWILLEFAHHVREGLIPNLFPEGRREALYHTADATLWFFHALDRYVEATGDREALSAILPKLLEIIELHESGTSFGIGVDPADGLLRQGAPGYQLTWMDAKVGDWVVTPRRGKAVEINALWYNALRLMQAWMEKERSSTSAGRFGDLAERAFRSFNERFWGERLGYLYDVVDGERGDDPSLRPNQIMAISLRYPALDPSKWQKVLETVRRHLLTPRGLRTLAPSHPDYKPRYDGDLRARDAAYHQGTVWPWLIGPFVDAWLRVYPSDLQGAADLLTELPTNLNEAGVGTISEICDAAPPYTERGCIAQAWSVAEWLRCRLKTQERKADDFEA